MNVFGDLQQSILVCLIFLSVVNVYFSLVGLV